jgi:hypothetical protein
MHKTSSKERGSTTQHVLPKFENKPGQQKKFAQAIKRIPGAGSFVRTNGYEVIKVKDLKVGNAAYKKLDKYVKAMKKEAAENKDNQSNSKNKTPDTRRLAGILEDVKASAGDKKKTDAFVTLEERTAVYWCTFLDVPETEEEGEKRLQVWNEISAKIPEKIWKFFPKWLDGNIAYVVDRVLELKSEASGAKSAEVHARFEVLKLSNTGRTKSDWADFYAEFILIQSDFGNVEDAPTNSRIHKKLEAILAKDSRTDSIFMNVMGLNSDFDPDQVMDKMDYWVRKMNHDDGLEAGRTEERADEDEHVHEHGLAAFHAHVVKRACWNLAKGSCSYGSRCKFSHANDDIQRYKEKAARQNEAAGNFKGKCYNCQGFGHRAVDCPDKDKGNDKAVADKPIKAFHAELVPEEMSAKALMEFMRNARKSKNGRKAVRALAMEVAADEEEDSDGASLNLIQVGAHVAVAVAKGGRSYLEVLEGNSGGGSGARHTQPNDRNKRDNQNDHSLKMTLKTSKEMHVNEMKNKANELARYENDVAKAIRNSMLADNHDSNEVENVPDDDVMKQMDVPDYDHRCVKCGSDVHTSEEHKNLDECKEERRMKYDMINVDDVFVVHLTMDMEETDDMRDDLSCESGKEYEMIDLNEVFVVHLIMDEASDMRDGLPGMSAHVRERGKHQRKIEASERKQQRRKEKNKNQRDERMKEKRKMKKKRAKEKRTQNKTNQPPDDDEIVYAFMNGEDHANDNDERREAEGEIKGRRLIIDNACTRTVVGDLSLLSGQIKPVNISITGVDSQKNVKSKLKGIAEGDLEIEVRYRGNEKKIVISKAIFVPGIPKDLISVRDLGKAGIGLLHPSGGKEVFLLSKKGKVLAKEVSNKGLYTIMDYTENQNRSQAWYEKDIVGRDELSNTIEENSFLANTFTGSMNIADIVHLRLAHISHKNKHIAKACRCAFGDDYVRALKNRTFCEGCVYAKATRLPFPKVARRKATRPLERVHFDIIGKMPVEGMRGERYTLVFVDEKTGMIFAYHLRNKSEVFEKVLKFKMDAEKHWRGKYIFGSIDVSPEIIALCSDGAGENTSNRLSSFLDQNHIKHELMVPYEHEQRGLIERANRTVWEGAEATRHSANLPPNTWPEMIDAYVYVRNLMPNNTANDENGKSPFEVWNNHEIGNFKSLTKHLRVIGCTAYAFVPKELRNRTQKRVIKCFLIGYAKNMKAYILSSMSGVRFQARNVYFNETEMAKADAKRTVAEAIDERMLAKYMKKRNVHDQVLDEAVHTDGVHDVMNIRPLERTAMQQLQQRRDERKMNDIDDSKGDMNEDSDDIDGSNEDMDERDDDHEMDNDVYDDDYEMDHKHNDDNETKQSEQVIRRTTRQKKPSKESLESISNTPPKQRRRLAREAAQNETEEIQARITIADEAQTSTEERATTDSMIAMREMIGKRIELLTVVQHHALVTRVHGADIPKTRKQMLNHSDSELYILGEQKEIEAFARLKVLELVDRPADKNVMKCGWVYEKKRGIDGQIVYKARLVAKGYSQVYGMDFYEVFSPTMQVKTLRTMLALAANDADVMTETWDVSSAFLYAPMDEEVYVEQPKGYEIGGKEMVCRMRMSMYGTKQASRNWYSTVHDSMMEMGFVQSENDKCLYSLMEDGKYVKVIIHVDDFAVFHNDAALCADVYGKLCDKFKMKRGPLTFFLGMRVGHYMDGSYSLDQEQYTNAILKRFNMNENTKSASSPETPNVKLTMKDCPTNDDEKHKMKQYPYAELAGSVQYLVVGTRIDIAHACSKLSRFMQNPGLSHWNAGLRVLKYLKGTQDFKLWYVGEGVVLNAWSDADHAGCVDTRRSHSGYIVKIGSTAVAWQCKRQGCVALSSCESEYVACCMCAKQVVWMRRLLEELGHKQSQPTPIYSDNEAARMLSENPIQHDRTKHIDNQYHYIRSVSNSKIVKVIHVPSVEEEADILTKEYVGPNFRKLRDRAMGRTAKRALQRAKYESMQASKNGQAT